MKKLLIFLVLFPCAAFAGPFGGGDFGWYLLIFSVAFSVVVTAPFGILGGFVSSFFTCNRNTGFLGVSVVLAGVIFLSSGKWGVDAGISGVLVYLFLECFLIYSFLAGWWISGWIRRKIGRSGSGFQLALTGWLPMCRVGFRSDNEVDLKSENVDSHGLPCGNFERPSAMPGIDWVAMLISGFFNI